MQEWKNAAEKRCAKKNIDFEAYTAHAGRKADDAAEQAKESKVAKTA